MKIIPSRILLPTLTVLTLLFFLAALQTGAANIDVLQAIQDNLQQKHTLAALIFHEIRLPVRYSLLPWAQHWDLLARPYKDCFAILWLDLV
ncbi:hypothetical protein [Oceanicoccus sp. KOV_DT_Chl]|uniref:hypothetical protein n=1 Tax=Oceanicoccus sp. KOV_DT_Chl TaxID=1904639 RepID=UPI00190E8FFB|nr:hypothetical protein [Oceanicoccus sp. KOV_DT_Chl]